EVVLGEGKTPEQVIAIARHMVAAGSNVLVTRLAPEGAAQLREALPELEYHPTPRLAVRRAAPVVPGGRGTILVVSGGSADLPVAEEAAVTAEFMGNRVERLYDVAVAGLHPLLGGRERLWEAAVLIVVGGSEGELPSVVGGGYLWQAIKRPFQSVSRTEQTLLDAHIRNAERVVARSKELRGAFMKLVQMLSMRSDLFPPEALEVLSVVQSSVPAMPYARVQEVLRAELGAPPEERFRDFEPTAFAAASLGQVHRAVLPSGEPVAVKIQYPGVAATVKQDV